MTTETPPDWVLLEAAKLSGYKLPMNRAEWLRNRWDFIGGPFRALCDMIQQHEALTAEIEGLRKALEEAPIIGLRESGEEFKSRQDNWLKTKAFPALGEKR